MQTYVLILFVQRGDRIMRRQADVICQHNRDLRIIPLKIRVQDEDGEMQTYTVKGYRTLNAIGKVILPNEVSVSSHIKYFECKLNILGTERIVGLTYNISDNLWYIDV